MYTLQVENEYSERLELTHNPDYIVTGIEGLQPSSASINTSTIASFDGSKFNSSRVNERNIVVTVVINGDIEKNRINLYRYFRPKKICRLYFKNDARDVYIEGYVDTFEISLFAQRQAAQISIICPEPYFKAAEDMIIEFSVLTNEFYFEFAIEEDGIPFSTVESNPTRIMVNSGDVESGLVITLRSIGEVTNPKIYNVDTNEMFGLNITMLTGDVITINTNRGQKTVYLTREGETINIINRIVRGSSWFTIRSGANTFTYESDTAVENLSCTFTYTDKFEGV